MPVKTLPQEGATAGLSVRHGGHGQHYDVYVCREGKQCYVASRFRFGFVNQVRKESIPAGSKVYLRIVAEKLKFTMMYSLDGKKWNSLGSMDFKFLGGGFSGLLTGVYVDSPKNKSSKASFEYFDYIVQE